MHAILQPKKPARAGQEENHVAVELCVELKGSPETPHPTNIAMAETAPPAVPPSTTITQASNKRKIVSEEEESEKVPCDTESGLL